LFSRLTFDLPSLIGRGTRVAIFLPSSLFPIPFSGFLIFEDHPPEEPTRRHGDTGEKMSSRTETRVKRSRGPKERFAFPFDVRRWTSFSLGPGTWFSFPLPYSQFPIPGY